MIKYVSPILLLLSFTAASTENEALNIDQVSVPASDLAFPNDRNIQPTRSSFMIQNYVLMSNDLGERWGVITIQNNSAGRRTLSEKHLLALLADGERIFPHHFSHSFKAHETQSITIAFGENKFPILSIYTLY
ncbi:hypothetical protein [uncultured Shewanella sp.]|uniref:hypothetical protein n=1 Tax=uncultured Shewanella sp. TaxID=173975 RepID=UPI0026338C60|nr:hypothetical protein [uncultured Shewanella sp.]